MIKKLPLILFGLLITVNCYGAIAYDTAAGANLSGSTVTVPITIGTNDNRILVVGVGSDGSTTADYSASGVTYNSVAMTKINGFQYTANGWDGGYDWISLWYLIAPDTGSHNIVVSFTTTPDNGASAIGISLYGVVQQAPEANGSTTNNNVTPVTCSITTQTNNAWVVDIMADNFSSTDGTPGTGQTGRGRQSNAQDTEMSTKPVASAGATSTSWSFDDWGYHGMINASFAPYVASTTRRVMIIQ